jgi:catechol 2,3-dioxygenase-like lactoylglutathione lyase family enzyme
MATETETAVRGAPKQLGHIALRVRDLPRAIEFYRDLLGLELKNEHGGRVAFLGIREDASHELALFALGPDAPGPEEGRVGMYHMAWEMASFAELEALHERLKARGADIAGYSDGQCNVMFRDPDGNELEAIWEPTAGEMERLRAPGGPGMPKLKR